MSLPDNYDPTPDAKIWYRSANDGQLGWFVKRDGLPKIKYDRTGGREILKPFNKREWVLCEDRRKLTEYHIGEITFEADKVLCKILGLYPESQRQWMNLRNADRIKWIHEGPTSEPERIKLYEIIKSNMRSYNEKNNRKVDPE